jgi:hypothetical protein
MQSIEVLPSTARLSRRGVSKLMTYAVVAGKDRGRRKFQRAEGDAVGAFGPSGKSFGGAGLVGIEFGLFASENFAERAAGEEQIALLVEHQTGAIGPNFLAADLALRCGRR